MLRQQAAAGCIGGLTTGGDCSQQTQAGDFNNGSTDSNENGITGYDSDGVPSFDEEHPRFHSYNVTNSCMKTMDYCTMDRVFEGLLRFPAPGASGTPVVDEQIGSAGLVGDVRHEVYVDSATVINVTIEDEHSLHPGIVRRWVTEDKTTVTIHTYGEGTGILPGPNEFFSEWLWNRVDHNIWNYLDP